MQLKAGVIFTALALFVLSSCNKTQQFPEKKSEKFPVTAVTTDQPLFKNELPGADSLGVQILNTKIEQLKNLVSKYENRDNDFSLEMMESVWETEKGKIQLTGFENVSAWTEVTGFLLEITGKPIFANALQQLSAAENTDLSAAEADSATQMLKPFIFTKNVDHIFVNFFAESSVEYDHSLGGHVKITQELTGPNSLLLKFSTTEKRYIEVNILIPANAENPSVIEKNVKYVATPGEYCLIARKWKEGDFVEIKY